jgi:hypothetical protein
VIADRVLRKMQGLEPNRRRFVRQRSDLKFGVAFTQLHQCRCGHRCRCLFERLKLLQE